MKAIHAFILTLTMYLLVQPPQCLAGNLMTREEVLNELSRKSSSLVPGSRTPGDEKLDLSALKRAEHLIPKETLLPPHDLMRHQSGRSAHPESLVKGVPSDAPLEVDLRPRGTPVKKQDDGKCTAYGLTAGLENMAQASKLIPNLDLSEWHLWSFYRQYSAIAALEAVSKPGNRVSLESDFPQYGVPKADIKGTTYLKAYHYIANDESEMVREIMQGHVVYIAMETPKQMLSCRRVISGGSPAHGGHALLVEGYMLDGQRNPIAIIKNSWGAGCGDHGYQYLDMRVCHMKGFYCEMWALNEVSTTLNGSLPVPAPGPTPVLKKVCKRKWYAPWLNACEYDSAEAK